MGFELLVGKRLILISKFHSSAHLNYEMNFDHETVDCLEQISVNFFAYGGGCAALIEIYYSGGFYDFVDCYFEVWIP